MTSPFAFDIQSQLTPRHRRILNEVHRYGRFVINVAAAIPSGQDDFKAATELARNGLVSEISRSLDRRAMIACLVIGPK